MNWNLEMSVMRPVSDFRDDAKASDGLDVEMTEEPEKQDKKPAGPPLPQWRASKNE